MTHPTDRAAIDAAWAAFCHNGGMPLTTTPFDRATFKAGWDAALRALPLPACATGDDAAHEGGLMARVENHLRGQVGLPPAPSRPADDAGAKRCAGRGFVHNGGGGGRECPECYRPASPPYPLSPPADDAVALLVNARKCVELVNDNGYYDVWLARCNRVLANAAGRTTPADDPLGEAREALLKAARVAGPIVEQIRWRGVVLGREEYEALFAVRDAAAALLAAERAQRDAGAEGDQRAQDAKGGE